jgi:hypothetical protein
VRHVSQHVEEAEHRDRLVRNKPWDGERKIEVAIKYRNCNFEIGSY